MTRQKFMQTHHSIGIKWNSNDGNGELMHGGITG